MPSTDLIVNIIGNSKSAQEALDKFQAKIVESGEAMKTLGRWGQVGAAAIGVGAIAAIKMASDFQAQMTLLETAGGEAHKNIAGISSGILDMATVTGTSTSDLAEGMYTVEKAGIRGANGLQVLKAAAEGAKAENVDLGTATNAVTSLLMSYHLKASDAVSVENQLVAASGMAKTTMQEYAGSLAAVVPVASAAGINFAQVGGAIATLTQHGTSAQEATQELANTIRALQAPNQVAAHAMQQLGLNVTDVTANLGKRGLTGTIDLISEAIASKMGPSGLVVMNTMKQSQSAAADAKIMFEKLPASIHGVAQAYQSGDISQAQWRKSLKGMDVDQRQLAMQFAATVNASRGFSDLMKSGSPAATTFAGTLEHVMGGATGMNTALMLGGENMAYFKKATEEVSTAGQHAGSNISTWAKTQATFKVQADQAVQSLKVMSITIGTGLLPVVTPIIKGVTDFTRGLVANKPALIAVVAVLGTWAATVAAATIAQKAMVLWTGITQTAAAAATVAQWAWNAAMDANPIGIIITAIVALVAGLVWFFTQTKLGQQIWKGFTTALADAWTWLWTNVLQPTFQAIGAIFTWLYENVIRPIVIGIEIYITIWIDVILWLWQNVISPVFAAIGAAFAWIYQNVIKPIVGFIVLEIQGWGIIFNWLHDNVIKPVFDKVGAAFTWVWTAVVKPVGDFIGGAIKGIGDTIHNVFDGVAQFVGQAFQDVLSVVRGPINGLIDLINSVIAGLNSVHITLPSWMPIGGGQTFGLNIPSIPHLAAGTVTNGPMLALIGDNPGGREVVRSVDSYDSELRRAYTAGQTGGGGGRAGAVRLDDDSVKRLAAAIISGIQFGSEQAVMAAIGG